jgi:hypothetical protein
MGMLLSRKEGGREEREGGIGGPGRWVVQRRIAGAEKDSREG